MDETDVAREFLGFFKNFVDLFALQGRKVFIAGESYAGYYVPYIADAMLNTKDTTYYNVDSIMIYDPSTSTDTVQEQSTSPPLPDPSSTTYPPSPRRPLHRLLVRPLPLQRLLLRLHPPPRRLLRLHLIHGQIPHLPPARARPFPTQRLRPRLRSLDRHLQRHLAPKPLLRHLPSSDHLPAPLGRPRLPRLLRLSPRRRLDLLQSLGRASCYQCPSHRMGGMYQHGCVC